MSWLIHAFNCIMPIRSSIIMIVIAPLNFSCVVWCILLRFHHFLADTFRKKKKRFLRKSPPSMYRKYNLFIKRIQLNHNIRRIKKKGKNMSPTETNIQLMRLHDEGPIRTSYKFNTPQIFRETC